MLLGRTIRGFLVPFAPELRTEFVAACPAVPGALLDTDRDAVTQALEQHEGQRHDDDHGNRERDEQRNPEEQEHSGQGDDHAEPGERVEREVDGQ